MPRNELCAGCGHSKPTEKLRHLLDATEGRHPEWNIAYDISTPAKICKYCYTDRLLKRASVDDQRQTRAAAAAAAPLKPVRPYAREPDTGEHSAPPSIAKRERPEDEGKDEDAEKRARAEELGDSGAVGGGNEGGEETSEVESTNESEDETLEELAPFPEVPAARAMEDAVRSELDERGFALRRGQRPDPGQLSAYHSAIVALTEEVVELRALAAQSRWIDTKLDRDGGPPLRHLLEAFVRNGNYPLGQVAVWRIADGLINGAVRSRQGRRFNPDSQMCAIVARSAQSGRAAMEQWGGGSDPDLPNDLSMPSPVSAKRYTIHRVIDAGFFGASDLKLLEHFEKAEALHHTQYTCTFPLYVSLTADSTDLEALDADARVVADGSDRRLVGGVTSDQESDLNVFFQVLSAAWSEASDMGSDGVSSDVHSETVQFLEGSSKSLEAIRESAEGKRLEALARFTKKNKGKQDPSEMVGKQRTVMTGHDKRTALAREAVGACTRGLEILHSGESTRIVGENAAKMKVCVDSVCAQLVAPATDYCSVFAINSQGTVKTLVARVLHDKSFNNLALNALLELTAMKATKVTGGRMRVELYAVDGAHSSLATGTPQAHARRAAAEVKSHLAHGAAGKTGEAATVASVLSAGYYFFSQAPVLSRGPVGYQRSLMTSAVRQELSEQPLAEALIGKMVLHDLHGVGVVLRQQKRAKVGGPLMVVQYANAEELIVRPAEELKRELIPDGVRVADFEEACLLVGQRVRTVVSLGGEGQRPEVWEGEVLWDEGSKGLDRKLVAKYPDGSVAILSLAEARRSVVPRKSKGHVAGEAAGVAPAQSWAGQRVLVHWGTDGSSTSRTGVVIGSSEHGGVAYCIVRVDGVGEGPDSTFVLTEAETAQGVETRKAWLAGVETLAGAVLASSPRAPGGDGASGGAPASALPPAQRPMSEQLYGAGAAQKTLDELDLLFDAELLAVVELFPKPLASKLPPIIPSSRTTDFSGKSIVPFWRIRHHGQFLNAAFLGKAVTMDQWIQSANGRRLHLLAKSTKASGFRPISSLPLLKLRELATQLHLAEADSLPAATLVKKLTLCLERLQYVAIMPVIACYLCGAKNLFAGIPLATCQQIKAYLLPPEIRYLEAYQLTAYLPKLPWSSPVSVPRVTLAATQAKFDVLTTGFQGSSKRSLTKNSKGKHVSMDPAHNYHNFVSSLGKAKLPSGEAEAESGEGDGGSDLDDGSDGGGEGGAVCEYLLSPERVLEAALQTGDQLLVDIANGACDPHSQACSMALLCSSKLEYKMRELGFERDALVIRIIGRAWRAITQPHFTQASRTKALYLLAFLIYRVFGNDLYDVRVLRKQQYAGYPLHQLLTMIGNGDIRQYFLEHAPGYEGVDATGNGELWGTTFINESHFGTLPSFTGGKKPSGQFIAERADNLEVVASIKADLSKAFSSVLSRRKWKVDDAYCVKFNDGTGNLFSPAEGTAFYEEIKKRAKRAAKNRSTVRGFNQAKGGTGK